MNGADPDGRTPLDFSLLMAIYAGDDAAHLFSALDSVAKSTILPTQLVLVQDGVVPQALTQCVEAFRASLSIDVIVLPDNVGLGPALQLGLEACRHRWVARFDSDDVLVPERFERQIAFLADHPETAALGGFIAEFDGDPTGVSRIRRVPLSSEAILKYARMRNPINHMTVMFDKQAVQSVGGYRDERGFEDYSLWARMLCRGAVLANLPIVLVHARAGDAMIARRGGLAYAALEVRLQTLLYKIGLIGPLSYCRNLILRMPPRLIPSRIRSLIYAHVLRRGWNG